MIKRNIFFLKFINCFEIYHSSASFCEAKSCLLKLNWKVLNIKHFLQRHFWSAKSFRATGLFISHRSASLSPEQTGQEKTH